MIVRKGANAGQLFATRYQLLTTIEKEAFENIMEKGENTGYQHFLLFENVFYYSQININF